MGRTFGYTVFSAQGTICADATLCRRGRAGCGTVRACGAGCVTSDGRGIAPGDSEMMPFTRGKLCLGGHARRAAFGWAVFIIVQFFRKIAGKVRSNLKPWSVQRRGALVEYGGAHGRVGKARPELDSKSGYLVLEDPSYFDAAKSIEFDG